MSKLWKDITNYENLYQVSRTGKVRNNKGNIVKPFDNKGYERVQLYKDGDTKNFLVHRLVAETFLPIVEGREQVNHIDLNRKNNHIDNLEWVNGSENVRHAVNNIPGRLEDLQETMSDIGKKYNHIGVEASKKRVAQIDRGSGATIAVFESAREASRITGANYRNISQVCRGNRKTHMGYKWSFV